MKQKKILSTTLAVLLCLGISMVASSRAQAAITPPGPASGSVGLEGTISSPPPKQGATISSPGNGSNFTAVPITVNGICPTGLLVKLFSNNVFVGSVQCTNGSYSIQVDLFSGQNQLVARVYDALDQAGPDSNTVTVTYTDAKFLQFGTSVSLSSVYARRGANPGEVLEWPIVLSGGTGPYAISVDWGDGSPTDLTSQTFAGNFTIKHTYKAAGVYKIIIKATDKNGSEAFLQLVGVANGKVGQTGVGTNSKSSTTRIIIIWWPMLLLLPLIPAAFWAGQRNELYVLRKKLERTRDGSIVPSAISKTTDTTVIDTTTTTTPTAA
ncbi:MAG: hypothetical protein QFB87_01600 [Patescibacteria group bacterium]|nr:hypothetical protein [Patescibacteria group bacterium]